MLSSKNISRQEASPNTFKNNPLRTPAPCCTMLHGPLLRISGRTPLRYHVLCARLTHQRPAARFHMAHPFKPGRSPLRARMVFLLGPYPGLPNASAVHAQAIPAPACGVYAVVAYSLQSWTEHPYPALPWVVSMLWWALYEAAEHLYVRYKAMNETIAHASILEARIRPHFLFNVLNCLRAMAPSQGPIGPALEDAAQLLRLALKPHSSFVRYCDERERLEHYLRLEQLRLEERLQVRWHVDEDVEDYDPWMPGFILQPLIENAIRHGIEKTPGHIDVALMHSGSYLQLEVTNPVPSNATEPLRYQGLGLAEDDVRVRLHLLYDQQASYSVHTTGTTHTATVRLPWSIGISG